MLTHKEDAAPCWLPPGNYNLSELQAKAQGSSSLGPNLRSSTGVGGSCVWPRRDLADAEQDSSLQSSRAGWLITQTGPRGVQLMRAPTVLGGAALCPPPPGGLAPCQLRVEGRAGWGVTRGELLQKTQQCFWKTSRCHKLQRLQGAGVAARWDLGFAPVFFFSAAPSLPAVGERGACKPCNPKQVSELLCLPGLGGYSEPPSGQARAACLGTQTHSRKK